MGKRSRSVAQRRAQGRTPSGRRELLTSSGHGTAEWAVAAGVAPKGIESIVRNQKATSGSPAWGSVWSISRLVDHRSRIDGQIAMAVRRAREAGRSWSEIAGELGVSRQSAWERYAPIVGGLIAGPEL
jgi:hypothetical protein